MRGPRRGLYYLQPPAGEDPVECAGELGVAVPDQEAEGADPVAEVHEQVTGLLSGPGVVRVGYHTEDVHVPGGHFHDEQHVQTLEEDRVHVEEVAGEQSVRLSAQGRLPLGVDVPRGRSAPAGGQDPPHGRFADAVSEPAQFTVDSAVPQAGFSRASRAGSGDGRERLARRAAGIVPAARAASPPGRLELLRQAAAVIMSGTDGGTFGSDRTAALRVC